MRPLPIHQLPQSDIPQLFETVAAIKLDLSQGYSELLCIECERRMRTAAQARLDFLRVVQQWQVILHGIQPNVKTERLDETSTTMAGYDDTKEFVECELLLGENNGNYFGSDVVKQEDGRRRAVLKMLDEDEDDDDDDNGRSGSGGRRATDESFYNDNDDSDEDDDEAIDSDDDSTADRPTTSSSRKKRAAKKAATEKTKKPRKKYEPGLAKFGRPMRGTTLICDICGAQLSTK